MLSLITLALAALVTAMDVSHDVSIYYSGSEYSELNWSIVIEEFKEYATGLLPYILGMYVLAQAIRWIDRMLDKTLSGE